MSIFSIKHANLEIKKNAKHEVWFISIVSILPLVVAYFVVAFPLHDDSLWTAFVHVFLSGELYFYAMAICATIALLALRTSDGGNIDTRLWSFVFIIFCISFMVIYISKKNEISAGITYNSYMSVFCFLASIFLYYRVLVLSEAPPPMPEETNRKDVKKTMNAVEPTYD